MRLTLKTCDRLNESEVGPKLPDGGHQESEGVDTQAVCSSFGHVWKPAHVEEHGCACLNTIIYEMERTPSSRVGISWMVVVGSDGMLRLMSRPAHSNGR